MLKENLDKINDKHLATALQHCAKFGLELQDEFYDILIPITKEFLKNMNREHNWAFGKIVVSLA